MTHRALMTKWFGLGAPAALGEPSQMAVDSCAPYGGMTLYEEGDYDWTASCANGMACTWGAEGGLMPTCMQKAVCSANREYRGPAQGCVCKTGFVPDPSSQDPNAPCVQPGPLQVPFTEGAPCTVDDGQGTGVYDAQGHCVRPNAYPGDECTIGGQPGFFNAGMACIPTAGPGGGPGPGTGPGPGGGGPGPGGGSGTKPETPPSSTNWPLVAGCFGLAAIGGAILYSRRK